MRTTVDLPERLLRRAKAAAALEGKSLKSLLAEALQARLGVGPATTHRRRVSLPLIRSRRPGHLALTGERVAEALDAEDVDAATGR